MCVAERTMPSTLLWAVDVYGRVYNLSTAGQQWEHCRDAHLEFKRVTAALQCCWSIACDHNIYLCVHGSEVPIRFREETYENQVTLNQSEHHVHYVYRKSSHLVNVCLWQRWNPVDGFSDRLLPSDRWQWSDVTGLQHQPLDSFQPPSENWEWEADWYVDENFGGEPTEKGVSEHARSAADVLVAVAHLMHNICRVGHMLSISRPLTLKTRSGTLVCAVADGYATGGTSHKIPGLRCV